RSRRRATIQQTLLAFLAVAAPPLRDRAHAHAGGLGRRRKRPTLTPNPFDRQAAAVRTGPRVSVQLHPDHPPWSWWLGSSSLQGGPDGTTLSGTTPRLADRNKPQRPLSCTSSATASRSSRQAASHTTTHSTS